MRLVDLPTCFNVTLLGGMIRARILALGAGARFDDTQIQRILLRTVNRLYRNLARQLPRILFYIYRDMGINKLEGYAGVQHRCAMEWINAALAGSIRGALGAVARSIPETFKTRDISKCQ